MELPETQKPYTAKQLAEHWSCSRQHIFNMIEKRIIKDWFTIGENRLNPKTGKIDKGMVRIPACEVLRIEGSRSTEVHGVLSGKKAETPGATPFVPRTAHKPKETTRNI